MTEALAAPAATKVVRVGVLSALWKIDPREAVDSLSGMIVAQIFDTPYSITAGDARVEPLLFEPLRTEGHLQYSAAVRPGVQFSDGTPLTAELAAKSLRGAKLLHDKATIDFRGDRVWFTLTTPNPRFDLTLTQGNTAIVLDRGTQLLGTGPFMFEQRPNLRALQSATSIRLVRNPHHRNPGGVDAVEFVVCPADPDGTPRALVEALRRGDVDLTDALTLGEVTANQINGVTPSLHPGNSTGILFFNCERRTLASPEVRRGIALAVDVHDVAARSFEKNPAAYIAATLLPPMMGRASGLPSRNLAESKRLLEGSGAKPARLSLLVPWAPRPFLPKPLPVAQALQRQLAEIGIAVDLKETRTSEEFFTDLVRGNYDLALGGWVADTPDPADFFEALLWSKMCEGDNRSNDSRWKNAEMDAALARFREQPTEEHKQAIHGMVRNEAPLVPLIYGQSVVVHSRKIRKVATNATGVVTLSGVTVSG